MSSLIKLSEVTQIILTDSLAKCKALSENTSLARSKPSIIPCVFLLSAPLAGVGVPEIVARSRRANCESHRQQLLHFLEPTLAPPYITQLT